VFKDECDRLLLFVVLRDSPPGTRWKEVRHDNKVTWLGSWTENVQGSIKYIMLNPSSRIKVRNGFSLQTGVWFFTQHLKGYSTFLEIGSFYNCLRGKQLSFTVLESIQPIFFSNQTVSGPIDFHRRKKICYGSQWDQKLSGFTA